MKNLLGSRGDQALHRTLPLPVCARSIGSLGRRICNRASDGKRQRSLARGQDTTMRPLDAAALLRWRDNCASALLLRCKGRSDARSTHQAISGLRLWREAPSGQQGAAGARRRGLGVRHTTHSLGRGGLLLLVVAVCTHCAGSFSRSAHLLAL